MTEVRNRVVQSLGAVDAEAEEELTSANERKLRPGSQPKTAGRCEGTPPVVDHEDVTQVEDAIGRTGGAANHPDGPGVGGD